ncbi:expressed unknown protein [Seminavis robusta]|uniref:Fe2OG dioxygenase domain-containing protein n=1 Tax=Seminavis robusta TaxID=568900 RepID=A0A9N8EI96_9STRA|nr:expressed unknown protein [Seminavis robusta]|eukprot:Sro1124_g243750.1 n/a (554) ;mRNA; r:4350-6011
MLSRVRLLEISIASFVLYTKVAIAFLSAQAPFRSGLNPNKVNAALRTFATKVPPTTVADKSGIDEIIAPDLPTIQEWTEEALLHCGTPGGYQALQHLGQATQQRLSYDFDANKQCQSNVRLEPQLFPKHVTGQVSSIVKEMESQGLLSTNLDSVDGLPSFHLNLVSNGQPLFPKEQESVSAFGRKTQELLTLVEPYIYNHLLPQARVVGQSKRLAVSDIFLRRYGQDSEDARNGISAHYDVFSKVTSVIAMDNAAASGNNGLYTTATGANTDQGTSSNHASLRRYFPLKQGDAVIHTWDVLHGVDVLPGSDRTSLIVWFTEEPDEKDLGVSPWLLQDEEKLENDDVTQFVLASALASANELASDDEDNDGEVAAMYHTAPPQSKQCPMGLNSQRLYLQSAARGNSFALFRVGSICEGDEWGSKDLEKQAKCLLELLATKSKLPRALQEVEIPSSQYVAWQFWWESAVRGNPNAQVALADDLMVHATTSSDICNRDESVLLATVLYGLAAQQGIEDALDRLTQVVGLEVDSKGIETEAEFLNSPVVQTAQAATS